MHIFFSVNPVTVEKTINRPFIGEKKIETYLKTFAHVEDMHVSYNLSRDKGCEVIAYCNCLTKGSKLLYIVYGVR